MTRSISLAVFFVLILAGVFWLTSQKEGSGARPDSPLALASTRAQVMKSDREGRAAKFQLAISTDPSALNQMNRESEAIASSARASLVLVSGSYKTFPLGKLPKKLAGEETRSWVSSGVLVGDGNEVLGVMPSGVNLLDIQVRFQNGSEVKADFIGRDDATGIVLLRLVEKAPEKALSWRNRRTLEWGEHLYALAQDSTHGVQMLRVMVSGDAILSPGQDKNHPPHYRQLDQVLPSDFGGAVLLDGDGQVAGLVLQPDAPEQVRALILDAGAVRVVTEALRSLQKKE